MLCCLQYKSLAIGPSCNSKRLALAVKTTSPASQSACQLSVAVFVLGANSSHVGGVLISNSDLFLLYRASCVVMFRQSSTLLGIGALVSLGRRREEGGVNSK